MVGRSRFGVELIELPDDPLVRSLFLAEDPVRADLAIAFGSSDLLEAMRRADRAAQLYRDGFVSRVLFSGGDPAGLGRSEAAIMADAATQGGLPPNARLFEDQSNSTAENVLNCRRMLAENGELKKLKTILLVSTWGHLRRVRALAGLAFGPGVRLVCCAAEGQPNFEHWVYSPDGRRALEMERELLPFVNA